MFRFVVGGSEIGLRSMDSGRNSSDCNDAKIWIRASRTEREVTNFPRTTIDIQMNESITTCMGIFSEAIFFELTDSSFIGECLWVSSNFVKRREDAYKTDGELRAEYTSASRKSTTFELTLNLYWLDRKTMWNCRHESIDFSMNLSVTALKKSTSWIFVS